MASKKVQEEPGIPQKNPEEAEPDLRAPLRALLTQADMQALPTHADMELFVTQVEEDMESLVARVEEAHRRDLEARRREIQQRSIDETMLFSLGKHITHLEQIQSHQPIQTNAMQLRYKEFEDRSRCKNLRSRGVPEAVERETLQKIIQAICLQLATPPTPQVFEFERLHRSLGPRSVNLNRPREVICCFHRYAHKEMISRGVWETGEITYEASQMKILPDLSRATLLLPYTVR